MNNGRDEDSVREYMAGSKVKLSTISRRDMKSFRGITEDFVAQWRQRMALIGL